MRAGFIKYTVKNWKQTTKKKQGLVENIDLVYPILILYILRMSAMVINKHDYSVIWQEPKSYAYFIDGRLSSTLAVDQGFGLIVITKHSVTLCSVARGSSVPIWV